MAARILIVDDEEQIRRVLRRKLEQCGYEVDEASDGNVAIRKASEQHYDLVIADIIMPERDGLEVIMHLRRHQADVKVIAVSAPSNHLYLDSAKAFGASRTFSKPFELAEIERAVHEILEGSSEG